MPKVKSWAYTTAVGICVAHATIVLSQVNRYSPLNRGTQARLCPNKHNGSSFQTTIVVSHD